jgi:D-apionolactonase
MQALTEYQFWYGTDRPPAETRELRAGRVTALMDGIDLRYIRLGSLEMVRRVYVAARDQNWNTIPGQYHIDKIEQQADSFRVEFEVEHRSHDLHFAWRGRIIGSSRGQIRYDMDGVARSVFRYNRVGLCVLHPFRECAGRPYSAQTSQGQVSGRLPAQIGPQRFEQGFYVPLFPAFSHLTIDLTADLKAQMDFEGDLFEMEDQRNWTDASFKTYCTPLSLGFPHQVQKGQHIQQSFLVTAQGTPAVQAQSASQPLRISLGEHTGGTLPSIGFALSDDGATLTTSENERLRLLKPDHLRVDIHLKTDYSSSLAQATQVVRALNCSLEVALFLVEETADQLHQLASLLENGAAVARFLVFQEGAQTAHPSETTPPRLVELARQHLKATAPLAAFVGGTDMYFCELNRTRPQVAYMDGVSYTIIPQAHAFDERSLSETLEAQAETVKSAQAFAGDRPIIVSPVTFKRRYNPHATVAEAQPAEGELPDAVDPRQMSLFGAAWTAGSIKYLSESGASSLTYFETTGWQGLMERASGSALPTRFPSAPGMIFPLYHVFADIAEWKGGSPIACTSNQPLSVAALAIEHEGKVHLLVMNFTSAQQRVVIGSLAGRQVWLRSLDASTAHEAMFEPENFRQDRQPAQVQNNELTLDMAPYATVRIDQDHSS